MEFLGTIHDLSLQYASVAFGIIDIDQCPALVSHLGIAAQPGIVIYWRQKQAALLSGLNAFHNTTELEAILRFELEQRGAKKEAAAARPDVQGIIQQAVHLTRVNQPSTDPAQPASGSPSGPLLKLRSVNPSSSANAMEQSLPSEISATAPSHANMQYLPNRQYELFSTTTNMKVIESKTKELGKNKMTEEEVLLFTGLLGVLADESKYSSSNFEDGQLEWLERALNEWPVQEAYVLVDVLRMAVLHPLGRAHFLRTPFFIPRLIENAHHAPFAYQFMTFKVLANLFASRVAKQMILEIFEKILSLISHLLLASAPNTSTSSSVPLSTPTQAPTAPLPASAASPSPSGGLNKNLQLVISAVILNYSTFFLVEHITDDIFPPKPLVNTLSMLFLAHTPAGTGANAASASSQGTGTPTASAAQGLTDDAVFRAFLALGTLACHSPLSRPLIQALMQSNPLYFAHLNTSQILNQAPLSAHASIALSELLSLFSS